jgi:uncharacterized protein YjbI with pentapeptide repeats
MRWLPRWRKTPTRTRPMLPKLARPGEPPLPSHFMLGLVEHWWWALLLLVVAAILLFTCTQWAGQLGAEASALMLQADLLSDPKDRLTAYKDALQYRTDNQIKIATGLAQGFGALVLAVGVYFTWRTVLLTQRRLDVDREAQLTNRFTQAIGQLGAELKDGSPNLETRLGAIYALERIARDSPRDSGPILEVLTAYVRQHAPWPPPDGDPPSQSQPSHDAHAAETSDVRPVRRPRADIQAALTAIGRRARPPGYLEPFPIDLSRTDLRGALLLGAHLDFANLQGAHLEDTVLTAAELYRATLTDAYLTRASLMNAILPNAHLIRAHLQSAVLVGAHLESAKLAEADLQGAELQHAHMQSASLWSARLQGANLAGADLVRANLNHARLQQAVLLGAMLHDASLCNARLEGAVLAGPWRPPGVPDYGIPRDDGDERPAEGLTWDRLRGARVDNLTQLPSYLRATWNHRTVRYRRPRFSKRRRAGK